MYAIVNKLDFFSIFPYNLYVKGFLKHEISSYENCIIQFKFSIVQREGIKDF